MRIEIDQSGKVEQTEKDTVVAFANGKQKSLLIQAKDKRKIQQVFREAGKPDVFVYKTFAILLFLLIRDELSLNLDLVIDKEYIGHERLVKHTLLKLIRKHGTWMDKERIWFDLVDRKSPAHALAIGVLRDEIKPDVVVHYRDVISYVV